MSKGGIALELRLPHARATRDLDLLLSGSANGLLERLQAACARDQGDRLRFIVSTDPADLDAIDAEGMLYEGFRFRVSALIGEKPYGDRFGLDIVLGGIRPGNPNGRVKDLPDIALLAQTGQFEASAIRVALDRTFRARRTHPLPQSLPDVPAPFWEVNDARLARLNRLPWVALTDVLAAARAFIDPVLRGDNGTWAPARWLWNKSK